MKTSKLFLEIYGLVCVGAMLLALTGCPTEEPDPNTGPDPVVEKNYNDTPITTVNGLVGTKWSDGLLPESTIEFTNATQVRLEGRYFKKEKLEINGVQKPVDLSGTKTYEAAGDFSLATVEPAVWVLMDTKRTGIELYYYKADETTRKHQRLVVYATGILQPREFYLYK